MQMMRYGADTNQPSTVPWRAILCAAACLAALPAHASIFQGEVLDKVASVLALVVIVVVPIVLIVLFWMVHVLPEKIAHKRHHPQRDAIHVLCLLSLFFGGLLWPLAWLWAYTKPVLHKLAYGTDKHEDYHAEHCGGGGRSERRSASRSRRPAGQRRKHAGEGRDSRRARRYSRSACRARAAAAGAGGGAR